MKSFITRILVFCLLQMVIAWAVWNPDLPRQRSYLGAIIDKHKRLESLTTPKIILMGGSSMAFGVKSDLLERELGMSVVNMSLAGLLGATFMLNEVAPSVSSGDLVVFGLEYDYYGNRLGERTSLQLLEYYPPSILFIPRFAWKRFLDRDALPLISALAQKSVMPNYPAPSDDPGAEYARDGFNPWGDYVANHRRSSRILTLPLDSMRMRPGRALPPGSEVRERLTSFSKLCDRKGAKFVVTWPPHVREALDQIAPGVAQLVDGLRETPGVVLLDSPEDYAYERRYFYDASYHTTGEGAERRTRTLIDHIRRYLGQERTQ